MSRTSRTARTSAWLIAGLALIGVAGFAAITSARASASAAFLAGRTISGTVTTAAGTPAANETVKLLQKMPPSKGPRERPPGTDSTGQGIVGTPAPEMLQKGPGSERTIKSMKSDSSGHFVFTDVANGKYVVQAGLGKTVVRSDEIEVKDADPAPLNLKLAAK